MIHPATKMPLQFGKGSQPPNRQAREHLKQIRLKHGVDAARDVACRLEAFERKGGIVSLPLEDLTPHFRRI